MDDLKLIYDIVKGVYDNIYQDAYHILECIATHIYYPFKNNQCICKDIMCHLKSLPILEEHAKLIQERSINLCKECHNNDSKRKFATYKLRGLILVVTIAYCHSQEGIVTNKLNKWSDLLAITCTDTGFNSMYMELWSDCLSAINRVLTAAVREILRKDSDPIDYVMFGTIRSAIGYNSCDSIDKVDWWLSQCDVTDKPVDANKVNKALEIAHSNDLLLWLTEIPESQRSTTGFGYDKLCLEIAADLAGCAAAQFCIKTGCPIDMMIDYLQYCTMANGRQTAWGHDPNGMNSKTDIVDPAFSAVDLVETTENLRALDWLNKHDLSDISRLLAYIYVVITMSSNMWEDNRFGIAEENGVDPELLSVFCVAGGPWAYQCIIELGNWPSDKLFSYKFQKNEKLPVSFTDNGNIMLGIGVGIQLAVYDFSSPNAKEVSVSKRRRGMLKQLTKISESGRRSRQFHWSLSSSIWQ